MAYRRILVHADQSPHAAARMALAGQLALACRAHLTGLACTGVSRYAQPADLARLPPQAAERLEQWRADARASLMTFKAAAFRSGLTQYAPRLTDDTAEEALLHQAAFHDLLILAQSGPGESPHGAIRDLPQNLLLRSGRPLLLIPNHDAPPISVAPPFLHPLLAWDGSSAAARAISNALPLLKMVPQVTLLMINAAPQAAGAAQQAPYAAPPPGPAMVQYLARHGVLAALRYEHSSVDVGDTLLAIARESDCDLLVMGGYGHRRLSETLLGGVTRTVLGGMPVPVLMAH